VGSKKGDPVLAASWSTGPEGRDGFGHSRPTDVNKAKKVVDPDTAQEHGFSGVGAPWWFVGR
jgi:hypothetical protein